MRLIITLFVSLFLAVWLGLAVVDDPGYMLLSYKKYSVEMPLWFAGIAILVMFSLLYFVTRFLSKIFFAPSRFRAWRAHNRMLRMHQNTIQGLLELAQGDWRRAEKNFIRALSDNENAVINYLGAARAAQEQGNSKKRDEYLKIAEKTMPKAKLSIDLQLAQLQIDNGQLEQALVTLHDLQDRYPRQMQVMHLLKDLYIDLGEWEPLIRLLPKLLKYKIISDSEYNAIEVMAHQGVIHSVSEDAGLLQLRNVWNSFTKKNQRDPAIVATYVDSLLFFEQHHEAETLLYSILKNQIDNELLELYGLAHGEKPAKQLSHAEQWLKQEPNNPVLLLCLGRIAMRNKLWGKARSYLENSIQYGASPEAYSELANLLEQLGESRLAIDFYRLGLTKSLSKPTEIPSVGSDTV